MFEKTTKRSRRMSDFTVAAVQAILALLLLGFEARAIPAPCPADLDGDGLVGAPDLNVLLAAWGTADPFVDFDGNGDVGCFELAYLEGNWGPCPTDLLDVDRDGLVTPHDEDFLRGSLGLSCEGDLDSSGVIDEHDVDALLCLWGTASPVADLDHDGLVGVLDLNIVLGNTSEGCTCDLDGNAAVNGSDFEIFTKGIGK